MLLAGRLDLHSLLLVHWRLGLEYFDIFSPYSSPSLVILLTIVVSEEIICIRIFSYKTRADAMEQNDNFHAVLLRLILVKANTSNSVIAFILLS